MKFTKMAADLEISLSNDCDIVQKAEMLSGVKFIPRDQIDREGGEKAGASTQEKTERGGSGKDKLNRKKSSRYNSSDEDSSSYSNDDGYDDKRKRSKRRGLKKKKRSHREQSDREFGGKKRNRRSNRKEYSSEDDASPTGSEGLNNSGSEFDDQKIVRREMGLEWMLRPGDRKGKEPIATEDVESLEAPNEENVKINPRELNPYLKDGGSGYPEEEDEAKANGGNLRSSSVVGDGGASWRLKALKRAQEQAAREGRKVNEVVAERWGSLGELAVSVSAGGVAPSRAHLRAINERRRGQTQDIKTPRIEETDGDTRKNNRDYLKDVSLRHPEMRVPKARDSLSWGKRRTQNMPSNDAAVISAAVSCLNKFSNDGSFMQEALLQSRDNAGVSSSREPASNERPNLNETNKLSEAIPELPEGLTANQMAAKAMQLRMKGKHEEAEKLLQELEKLKSRQLHDNLPRDVRNDRPATRYDSKDRSAQRKKEDDADSHLARSIMQNKQYSMSGRADDEYDYDGAPSKRSKKKTAASRDPKVMQATGRRFTTQQERCLFCFENPNRPKHLVISIANFTYLMLPQHQPVVSGHCCIVTLQHESSTRTVDDDVWDEFRNFKKCLIMMFAKQEKELVFLETVMGLAQQRRHCLIECIPLPADVAKEAPLYFKKAIDEAEDEWSQHNAKKLIDTSTKGLRSSIPKDFPYFHVEFGLNRGFVHVIEDEDRFKSGFGLNVIRGMLKLPEEDMHRRRQRHESSDAQKQSVAAFTRDWQAFDWTKQLD
ncbi:hypothetical protein MLD38_002534 [Melastoma candidum]|uniref:Uncharacterized protein n=1 Tax=Melastoma candidum TaxID=119954 RepID=A0ACB9S870_9MYRT|nr:hypothetical protein MLD38_002534 [Melastoma candidum]